MAMTMPHLRPADLNSLLGLPVSSPLRHVLPRITTTCRLSPAGVKHGLQYILFPPPALTARFHHALLEHQRHPLAARTPLRMTWHTTWPLCSVKRSVITCQVDDPVEDHQAEARRVEDQVVEARRVVEE